MKLNDLIDLIEVYNNIVVLEDIDGNEITDNECFDYAQCFVKHLDDEVCEIEIICSGELGLRVRLDCQYKGN